MHNNETLGHTVYMLSFRDSHIIRFFHIYESDQKPLDYALACYFRKHTALGPKDRGYIGERVYAIIRWMNLMDHITGEKTWESRLSFYETFDFQKYLSDEKIPPEIRLSAPKELYDAMLNSYGENKAFEILLASNFQAPTAIRINPLKTTRQELFQKWKNIYDISETKESPYGILFHKKINFFSLDEFKNGFFEVQDEASQIVSNMVNPSEKDKVLDFCSGSGGKTLGFAFKMNGQGQIFLHDVREKILIEAKKRLRRAGIQNAQILHSSEEEKMKKLKKKFDWIIVDAPCTGTGTLRRNPEMKYRFSEEMLLKLRGEQRKIFEKALSFLKKDGKILYSTCSLLKEENEEQIDHFKKTYGLKIEGEVFKSLPSRGGKDGLFGAVMVY